MKSIYFLYDEFKERFKSSVYNFDSSKLSFEKYNAGAYVCFKLDGELQKFFVKCDQRDINLWKNHFIHFLNTGIFPNYFWVQIASKSQLIARFAVPFVKDVRDNYSIFSKKYCDLLRTYKDEYGYDTELANIGFHTNMTEFINRRDDYCPYN